MVEMRSILMQRSGAALRKKLALSASLLAVGAVLAGCAPDAVRSVDATGFNGFLRQIGTVCRPLQIGDQDIGEMLRQGGAGTDSYNYFLDVTSKLYYNRISPAAYRQSLTGFFGSGTANGASFDCILNNLPAQRPNAPP